MIIIFKPLLVFLHIFIERLLKVLSIYASTLKLLSPVVISPPPHYLAAGSLRFLKYLWWRTSFCCFHFIFYINYFYYIFKSLSMTDWKLWKRNTNYKYQSSFIKLNRRQITLSNSIKMSNYSQFLYF